MKRTHAKICTVCEICDQNPRFSPDRADDSRVQGYLNNVSVLFRSLLLTSIFLVVVVDAQRRVRRLMRRTSARHTGGISQQARPGPFRPMPPHPPLSEDNNPYSKDFGGLKACGVWYSSSKARLQVLCVLTENRHFGMSARETGGWEIVRIQQCGPREASVRVAAHKKDSGFTFLPST